MIFAFAGNAIFAAVYYSSLRLLKARPLDRLSQTKLHSKKLAIAHFWIATVGIVLYVLSMWVAGITQGLMWRAFDDTATCSIRTSWRP